MMKKALALLILGWCVPVVFAQSISTQGKVFWLSFMHNGYYDRNDKQGVTLQVIISAKRACSGTISTPLAYWTRAFSVEANDVTTIDIPTAVAYHDGSNYGIVSGNGLHILANDTVSVYCANIADYSFDASFVLPVDGLGDDYIIQCGEQSCLNNPGLNDYKQWNQTSAFLIVATEDNTVVNITPSVPTLDGKPAGVPYSVTLPQAGNTYHVRSLREGDQRDLSGSRITADDCKKIAVFNGNTLTRVPIDMSGSSGFDHVFEQAMPVRSWGKAFVVTQSLNRNRDLVKIVSAANGNEIRKNGIPLFTLGANEAGHFYLDSSEPSCYIEASKNAAVYLYNTSSGDDFNSNKGDPSMVWIAPVEQKIDEVTFSTFSGNTNLTEIHDHFVNIVVRTEDIDNVYLDGTRLNMSEFMAVPYNSDFSYTRKSISHHAHHLSCAHGLNAHVYGFGDYRGYAYLVGSNAIDLSTNLTINDIVVNTNDVFQYCVEEPIVFFAEVNYEHYALEWNFGDGITSHDNPVTHTYHNRQVYPATLTVTAQETTCQSSSDTTQFYVDVRQKYTDNVHEHVCVGDFFSGYGFSNVLITNDTILGIIQPNPSNPTCPDSLLIHITAWPTYYNNLFEDRCWTGQPTFYNDHGFSFTYEQPGQYYEELPLTTIHGCDSIITLTLNVGEQITNEFTHHECNSSYDWDGISYTQPGDYTRIYTSVAGCDSIVTLHLTMGTPQHTAFDTLTCKAFVWNGETYTTSGVYTHHFETYDGCDSTVVCHLTIEGAIHHVFDTVTCKAFVWNGETYTASGTYTQILETPDGCDSIVQCNLSIEGIAVGETEYVTECDQFTWNGTTLTKPGFYTDTLVALSGCDSIARLQLALHYSPTPSLIACTDSSFFHEGDTLMPVITNTEFFSFNYDYYVEDSLNQIGSWDTCIWSISHKTWRIRPFLKEDEPHRRFCKVHVAEHCDSIVVLTCKIRNACLPDGDTIVRRICLKPSFFDVDETDAGKPGFSVAPNPNNGQMELRFERLTGLVEVRIYDMRGILIDQIKTFNDLETNILQYNLRPSSSGIYFFVATAKEGSVARKVYVAK